VIRKLRAEVAAASNAEKAPGMQACMKKHVEATRRDHLPAAVQAGHDLELLYANIEPNLVDKEFFIRKAIGWALRQYAWTDPSEVARYVREHKKQLSGLSRREAPENIG